MASHLTKDPPIDDSKSSGWRRMLVFSYKRNSIDNKVLGLINY